MNSLMSKISKLLNEKPVIVQMLRFVAIGALNTALDFIILNFVTTTFNVTSGIELGILNIVSFSAAVVQSYLWNKAWTFAEARGGLIQMASRLVLVGGLGGVAFITVLFGAKFSAVNIFFLMILAAFLIVELVFWKSFGLTIKGATSVGQDNTKQFVIFLIVSLIGLTINSVILVFAASFITPILSESQNAATIKNIAKILATLISLMWNFAGYKLLVFKR